jgi:broad specificity phosphatase PhoE
MLTPRLTLVRHGQASAHARDYDVLSALGIAQARTLGAHLAQSGARFDAIIAGPRKRQIDTARHLVEAAAELGVTYPAPEQLDAFDEIPLREILVACLPRWIDSDPVARALHERVHGRHSVHQVTEVLVRAMLTWARGDVVLDDVEVGTFEAFRDRFAAAAASLALRGNVLVATSAGPVAVSLHLAGQPSAAGPTETMHLAMEIANASITRLDWRDDRPLVLEANTTAHLAPADVTYI